MRIPWWSFLVLAAAFYFGFGYIPDLVLPNPLARSFAIAAMKPLAAFGALALVGLAVKGGYAQWRARKLFDTQRGLETLRALTWREFETLLSEAYRRRGYTVRPRGGARPDGGVDLVIQKDGTYLVQAKHWKAFRVGVKEIRELFGVVTAERATGGILVTTGEFTAEARRFAAGKALELITGQQLAELIAETQAAATAVPISDRQPASSSGAPLSEGRTPAAPTCPKCERPMVHRTARRGSTAGTSFWGCSGYPECRTTLPM
jgi:restriction system protein